MFSRLSTRRVLYRRPFVDKRRSPNALVTSPYTTTSASPRTSGSILKQAATAVTVLVGGSLFAVYYFDSRSAIHRYFFTPLIRNVLDPEVAHKVAVKVLKSGLAPRDMGVDDERLSTELWEEKLSNPIGLAAGFDKNGEAIDGLFNLGFSWVEIGSVTPRPQPGNPKPRVFHLPEDSAIINRYGFPSDGALSVLSRLRARLSSVFSPTSSVSGPTLFPIPVLQQPELKAESKINNASLRPRSLLAINLGKNKTSPTDSSADFIDGIRIFGQYADVLVVNISSPNTPGLRSMQSSSVLKNLLSAIVKERDSLLSEGQVLTGGRKPRLVLKVAPDLTEEELKDVASAIKSVSGVDGIIVSNTTIQRPSTLSPNSHTTETGGLSGPPLKPLTLRAIRTLRSSLPSSVPLIACGGVSSGSDALEYARAGANLVQMYTHFSWDGVGAVRRVKDELTKELEKEGKTWNEIVKNSVDALSEKTVPTAVTKDQLPSKEEARSSKPDLAMKVLIDEALAIREKLDALSEKMSVKEENENPGSVTP